MTYTGKIYIAGPMSGYKNFNFPAFHAAAYEYRRRGYHVFNPAEKDEEVHGKDFSQRNSDGDPKKAAEQGFNLRETLANDLAYVCREATHILMLKGWEKSLGARAEHATAVALGLNIIYQ